MSQRGHVNIQESIEEWVDGVAGALGGDRHAADEFAARVPAGYPQQVDTDLAALDARRVAALASSEGRAESNGYRKFQ
jgi:hypothetical protein